MLPHNLARPPAQLERLRRIHERLCHQRPLTARSMANLLAVSAKTIQRDLEYMRQELGLPLVYDPNAHSFRYSRRVEKMLFGGHVSEIATGVSVQPTPFASPLEIEHADDLAAICTRYGVAAEHVLRSMLRESFLDALENPRLMDNVIRGARALAMESEVAA